MATQGGGFVVTSLIKQQTIVIVGILVIGREKIDQ